MWVALSLLAAFGQALAWALKKKSLQVPGVNNTLAVVVYFVAGVFMLAGYGAVNGMTLPPITDAVVWSCIALIFLNVLASWTAYRAVDSAPLSMLMPFIALSALGLIPVEYLLRGVLPNQVQIMGMFAVVIGAIIFSFHQMQAVPLRAVGYFAVTVSCYSVNPALASLAIHDTHSPLLIATIVNFGAAIGFMFLVSKTKEMRVIRELRVQGVFRGILALMVLSGVVTALFENGPNMVALEYANASEVMAIKRTMPFFALVLGVIMFGEKVTRRHVLGTFFLVIGSFMIVWYK